MFLMNKNATPIKSIKEKGFFRDFYEISLFIYN